MSIWIIMPFLIFGIMALCKQLEKKTVFKQPQSEQQILLVRERRSLWKIAGYMILAGVIFFAFQPETMTVATAFFKTSLVCSIFFLDSIMKTKLYITDRNIYMIERFRNRSFVHAKVMNTEDIYNVEASKHYPGVYFMYYFGRNNQANRITLHIPKEEEREMFKFVLKQRMNINILRETSEEKINEFKRSAQGIDFLSKLFIWLSFITIILATLKALKDPTEKLTEVEHIISSVFVGLSIPLALYFFSYFFILTSGIIKRLNTVSVKTVALYLIIASSGLPFYELMQKGNQTSEEFIKGQLNGMLVLGIIILTAMMTGMVTKGIKEKKRAEAVQLEKEKEIVK